MNRPELLVPAGDMKKLETALHYGADAVYLGGEQFGLRSQAGNFTLEELAVARQIVRARNKRLYLTLNAYLRPSEISSFSNYLEELRPLDLDAYIVSDPGVLSLVHDIDPGREIHLSTQANTTNAVAAQAWQKMGVRRINLARELSLEEIRAIRAATDMELEVFIHGALCVAYSGRCLLSAALTDRSANQGACSHPCRWSYSLMENTRPGEYFPIEEDDRGTYIMNSRDLCLIEHMPEIISCGVNSLKIEGRMKTLYYVAAVTRVYRKAIDQYLADPENYTFDPAWREELDKVSHRPYDRGFLFGGRDPLVHSEDSTYRRTHDFVGIVHEILDNGKGVVEGRNRFFPGERLEVIGPAMRQSMFWVGDILNETGKPLSAAQPNLKVIMELPEGTQPNDLLRREKQESQQP